MDVVILLDAARPAELGSIADEAFAERERDAPIDPSEDDGHEPERPANDRHPTVAREDRRPDSDRDDDRDLELTSTRRARPIVGNAGSSTTSGPPSPTRTDPADFGMQHRRRHRRLDHLERDPRVRLVHPCLRIATDPIVDLCAPTVNHRETARLFTSIGVDNPGTTPPGPWTTGPRSVDETPLSVEIGPLSVDRPKHHM